MIINELDTCFPLVLYFYVLINATILFYIFRFVILLPNTGNNRFTLNEPLGEVDNL